MRKALLTTLSWIVVVALIMLVCQSIRQQDRNTSQFLMMDKSNRVISASKERHEQKIAHILESPLDPELDKDTWKYLNWERKELDLMIQKHNNEISCYGYDKETPASEYKPIPKIPAIQWPETAPP